MRGETLEDEYGEDYESVTRDDDKESRIGLCLSGGGYRAMLYHAGALWRMHEAGLLARVGLVSSVSGGSIAAGVLALAWGRLKEDPARFERLVVEPMRRLAAKTVDGPSIFLGIPLEGKIGDHVARAYREALFGRATLQDLPSEPEFVFNATSVQTKSRVRFTRAFIADYRLGRIPEPRLDLAHAVAASSAFPPFLSPVVLRFGASDWIAPLRGRKPDVDDPAFLEKMVLTDGGVYDNIGLQEPRRECGHVFVSDGGGLWAPEPSPAHDWPRHFYRVFTLVDSQVRALRKQQIIGDIQARNRAHRKRLSSGAPAPDGKLGYGRWGAYWSIWTTHEQMGAPQDALACPSRATIELARIPTRLKAMDAATQERLINWGYASADVALRRFYLAPDVHWKCDAPKAFPYPESGVG